MLILGLRSVQVSTSSFLGERLHIPGESPLVYVWGLVRGTTHSRSPRGNLLLHWLAVRFLDSVSHISVQFEVLQYVLNQLQQAGV